MKTAADIIIELIEMFEMHDAGRKRAHGIGVYHLGRVKLNQYGKDIFGELDHALVRLSNASTSEKVPNRLVSIKGCSVRFYNPLRPIDIIGVNFPYFPYDSAADTLELLYNINLFLERKSMYRFIKIFRAGGLYKHLGKLAKWMPKRTDMNHMFYSAHSYGDEYLKIRLNYDSLSNRIEIYAEKDEHQKNYLPGPAVHLGSIFLRPEPTGKEIKYFDVLNAPIGLSPNGEIPLLRHFIYKRSFLRRMEESELNGKKLGMLEEVWAEEKYFVMSRSHNIYNEIREVLKEGTDMSVTCFRELLDAAYNQKINSKNIRNYFQHVWGYFKNKANEEEKNKYDVLLKKLDLDEIDDFIAMLAHKYREPYLLDSTIVKTRGRA